MSTVCLINFVSSLSNESNFFHSGSSINKPTVTSVNGNGGLKRKASSSSSDSEIEKPSNNTPGNGVTKTNNQVRLHFYVLSFISIVNIYLGDCFTR